MKINNVFATVAAVGVALAPVAAHAGTRAGSSVVSASKLSGFGSRRSAKVEKRENLTPGLLIGGIALAAVAGAVVVIATDNNKSNGSN